MNMANMIRGAKFVAIILAGFAIAGCAKQNDQSSLAGAAAPGSQQDFVVNVGDRVFFDTDSSELSDQARATLDKQAQWLTNYNRYAFTVEGHADERGTREYNIARRAARRDGASIPDFARRGGATHAHHLLRQGAAGRLVQRYFLLVAKSPRRDGARSELVTRLNSPTDFTDRRRYGADCILTLVSCRRRSGPARCSSMPRQRTPGTPISHKIRKVRLTGVRSA